MARGHDQPNPALIIEGSRRPQPSKRVQGHDYPVSALEELKKRDKGTYYSNIMIETTNIRLQVILNAPELEGSSKNLSDQLQNTDERGKTYMRDMTKPVGDACREDGTLKDADELVWPDSPTESVAPRNGFARWDEPAPHPEGDFDRRSPTPLEITVVDTDDEAIIPQKRKKVSMRVYHL
jgi:hypothetical protein